MPKKPGRIEESEISRVVIKILAGSAKWQSVCENYSTSFTSLRCS